MRPGSRCQRFNWHLPFAAHLQSIFRENVCLVRRFSIAQRVHLSSICASFSLHLTALQHGLLRGIGFNVAARIMPVWLGRPFVERSKREGLAYCERGLN